MAAPRFALSELLPHRRGMLLLDAVLDVEPTSCRASATVRPGAWYDAGDGAMPAWVGLELMAQAAAVCIGHGKKLAGLPLRLGYLLGTRCYAAELPAFPHGACLEVEVFQSYLDPGGLAAFEGSVLLEGRSVARATLKAFEVS